MHSSSKPVRKCNGCGLNLRDRCGVFDNPHEQWERRRHCPGYRNETLLAKYKERGENRNVDLEKAKHMAETKQRYGEEHHSGDRHVRMNAHH